MKIKCLSLKHPIELENIILFNLDKFLNNNERKIIQIGQQLRKITSIYKIKNDKYENIWLTGNKSIQDSKIILQRHVDNNNE